MSWHQRARKTHHGAPALASAALALLACGGPTSPPGPAPVSSWRPPPSAAPVASGVASAPASALPSAALPGPARERKTLRSQTSKGSVLCEGAALVPSLTPLGGGATIFSDTCPVAFEVCCSHSWGYAACQPLGKGCPSDFVLQACDETDDCPKGSTCQRYQKNNSAEIQACSRETLGSEVCSQNRRCSRKDQRCVLRTEGDIWHCEPDRPPLRCGDELCQTPDAPVCIAEPGKPRRCGNYREGWTNNMECFRDGDCEKGAVCCVNSAQMSVCLRECSVTSSAAICNEQADCDRYFQRNRAMLRQMGLSRLVCGSSNQRGVSSCSPE